MMQHKTKLLFILEVFFSILAFGQGTGGFSRFYDSELSLNPAFAGIAHEKWVFNDILAITQLNDSVSFFTNSASFHLNFKFSEAKNYYGLKIITERDYRIGAGIHDERRWSSDYRYTYFSDYLTFAYHKMTPQAMISFGVQGGIFKTSDYQPDSVPGLADSLQPALIKGEYTPDFNFGIIYSRNPMSCWKDDQHYQFQMGISGYHLLQDFNNSEDTVLFPSRTINAHAGYLIKVNRAIGLIPRALYTYNGKGEFNGGLTLLLRQHERFFDRLRFGIHYKTSRHLVLSTGLRFFFGNEKEVKAIDVAFSYDIDVRGQNPEYYHQMSFSLRFYPFMICWETSRCSDAYKFEEIY